MSTTRIDSGRTGPVQQQTDIQETERSERTEQSTTADTATISESDKQAAASNATARASENQITGQILASQLQAQTPAAGAAKVPSQGKILVENPNVKDPKVEDFQKEINEFRVKNGQTPIKEDGIFGKETKAAVKEFQQASGLKDDGIVGDNTRSRLRLENSSSFQGLNPDTKEEIRGKMNGLQNDPTNRQLLTTIGLDENFAKLSRTEQQTALQDLKGSASSLTLKTMQGMKNDDLVKLGDQPGGQERLEGMKFALKQGPITADSLKELDRLNSATFKEGPGLKINGSPKDKADYLHLVRQEMLTSPSFAKTMNEINNDATRRPTTVVVGRDLPRTRLDADRFDTTGTQDIDLNDFDKLPRTPPANRPDAITQGEVLMHAMKEGRERVKGKDHDEAHKQAIIAENDYRKDIGQTSTRKLPPDDESRIPNDLGDQTLLIHFKGAIDEPLVFDDKQQLVF